MRSAPRGKSTSRVEVGNVSSHGFWLLVGTREVFLAFEKFPWFKDAPIGKLVNVDLPQPGHLYWPDLDVDLAVESLEHPERFPLVSRAQPNKRLQPARAHRAARPKRKSASRPRG
jgi:hypothetical protein